MKRPREPGIDRLRPALHRRTASPTNDPRGGGLVRQLRSVRRYGIPCRPLPAITGIPLPPVGEASGFVGVSRRSMRSATDDRRCLPRPQIFMVSAGTTES